MWIELPEMIEPVFVAELVTITPMKAGSGPDGGGVELPGSVDQSRPQVGVRGSSAKPLKLLGAARPLNVLSFAHCAPQNVTELPTAALWSLMTKLPPPGAKENPTGAQVVVAILPPTSVMVVVMVNEPADAYVCEPLTEYEPPAPVIVPAVEVPSPQSMLAEKSDSVPDGLAASVNVAVRPL